MYIHIYDGLIERNTIIYIDIIIYYMLVIYKKAFMLGALSFDFYSRVCKSQEFITDVWMYYI